MLCVTKLWNKELAVMEPTAHRENCSITMNLQLRKTAATLESKKEENIKKSLNILRGMLKNTEKKIKHKLKMINKYRSYKTIFYITTKT